MFSNDQRGNLTSRSYSGWPWAGTSNSAPYTTSFNSGSNQTTLNYVGATPLTPGQQCHVGYTLANGSSMVDVIGPDNVQSPLQTGAVFTTSAGNENVPALTLSTRAIPATWSGPTTNLLLYATAQYQGTANQGNTVGVWEEFLVPADVSAKVLLLNDDSTQNNLVLSQVGYMLSATEIPLEQLNGTYLPPSSFTPVPGVPDGTVLTYGAEISATVPEPSTLALLGVGAVALLGCAWRRRKAA